MEHVAESHREEIENLVEGVIDLIPLPKAYIRIRQLVHDPDSTAQDVAQVIQNDPAMTGRVLRIANSAYMALVTKVDTIPRAVQVLGLNQVHDLALAMSAVSALQDIPSPVFDIHDFWRRSVYCAVVSKLLTQRLRRKEADRAFVSGLLHDIGNLVLSFKEPETVQDAYDTARQLNRPLADEERQRFGFCYAEVSAYLLERWDLPASIIEPVRFHTQPSGYKGDMFLEVAIIHVAACIARAAMWRDENDEPVPEFDSMAMQVTHMNEESIDAVMKEADEQVVEAIQLLLPEQRQRRAVNA